MDERAISRHYCCEICCAKYDHSRHLPLFICSMHHTICRHCLANLNARALCPYCRQRIQRTHISVNYYVYDLLPESRRNGQANLSIRSNNVSSNVRGHQRSNEEVAEGEAEMQPGNGETSINYRPTWYVFGEEEVRQIQQTDERIEERLAWHRLSTFFIVVVQLPFIIINMCIALLYPFGYCMDISYQIIPFNLRTCFMSVSIIQLSLLTAMTAINQLTTKGYFSLRQMLKYGEWVTEATIAKVLLWGIAQVSLFISGMISYCSETIIGYGVVLMITHFTLGFLYLCHKVLTRYRDV